MITHEQFEAVRKQRRLINRNVKREIKPYKELLESLPIVEMQAHHAFVRAEKEKERDERD